MRHASHSIPWARRVLVFVAHFALGGLQSKARQNALARIGLASAAASVRSIATTDRRADGTRGANKRQRTRGAHARQASERAHAQCRHAQCLGPRSDRNLPLPLCCVHERVVVGIGRALHRVDSPIRVRRGHRTNKRTAQRPSEATPALSRVGGVQSHMPSLQSWLPQQCVRRLQRERTEPSVSPSGAAPASSSAGHRHRSSSSAMSDGYPSGNSRRDSEASSRGCGRSTQWLRSDNRFRGRSLRQETERGKRPGRPQQSYRHGQSAMHPEG